jgi:hypothetical protein
MGLFLAVKQDCILFIFFSNEQDEQTRTGTTTKKIKK